MERGLARLKKSPKKQVVYKTKKRETRISIQSFLTNRYWIAVCELDPEMLLGGNYHTTLPQFNLEKTLELRSSTANTMTLTHNHTLLSEFGPKVRAKL